MGIAVKQQIKQFLILSKQTKIADFVWHLDSVGIYNFQPGA